VKRILVLIALLGFGTTFYVLLQPAPSQVVRLEPVTPLPSQLEQPAPIVEAINTPVSSIKPRPTKPIEPRWTPVIKALPRAVETPAPTQTREPEKPVVTREPEKPVVTREPTRDATVKNPETLPSLTVRQEAGSWRVQAGAFRTQSNAEAMQSKIVASGLTARVVQGNDGIYRVLVGNYSTNAAAREGSLKVSSVIR
jgi:cell division protein FtsN